MAYGFAWWTKEGSAGADQHRLPAQLPFHLPKMKTETPGKAMWRIPLPLGPGLPVALDAGGDPCELSFYATGNGSNAARSLT